MASFSSKVLCKKNKETISFFLDELVEGSQGQITVMVCRKWDVTNIKGRYMSTDLILSDKKGNVMHCTAKSNIAHYFVDRLQEGNLYVLKDFIVQPNREQYRIMKDSSYIIELQGSTVVSRSTDDATAFVRHPFTLVEFESLRPTESLYFVDVVGYIAGLGDLSTKSNGGQTVDFDLTNERGRHVRVTLWGDLGMELLEKNKQQPDVHSIILTSMNVKYYMGLLCLSSSSSTLVLDSDDIPALQEFRSSLSEITRPIERTAIIQPQPVVTTIADLLEWSRAKKKEIVSFKGEVEITNIRTKNGWFNLACTSGKCRKGVSRKRKNFWCEACEKDVAFPRPRFKLQLDVKDDSGTIVVVLFDETAEQLTQTTAKDLLNEQNMDDNVVASGLPYVLENLLNTKHIFELRSHTYYQYGEYESFNCARVHLPEPDKKALQPGNLKLNSGSPSQPVKVSSNVLTPTKNREPKRKRKFLVDPESTTTLAAVDNLGEPSSPSKNRCVETSDEEDESLANMEAAPDTTLSG